MGGGGTHDYSEKLFFFHPLSQIIENPSEEQLLKAWKEEEVKRALARETKGEEPLTRPIKVCIMCRNAMTYVCVCQDSCACVP